VVFALVPLCGAQEAGESVRIGVLAKRGPERCLEKWGPTAEYLTNEIPGYSFTIVPLGYDEVYPSIERAEADFVLANPSLYVAAELLCGASRIVTLENLQRDRAYTVYGGVVFCRADREDIQHLGDLKGKTFMAVAETSFGGWQMAWRELREQGIDPYRYFAELRFGGAHDAVVCAVRDGEIDAGTVRTDTLERMASEGEIGIREFRVIDQHSGDGVDMPLLRSTRVYPEWPLAKAAHTSHELAKKVASALLRMSPDSPAAMAARCVGWTIPHNYQSVRECLKGLRVRPYEDYGKITVRDVVRQYWPWLLGVAVLAALVVLFAAYLARFNRKLKAALEAEQEELRKRTLADKTLRESEQRFRSLVETTSDWVWEVDDNGIYTYASPRVKQLLGYEPEEVIGKTPFDLMPPEEAKRIAAEFRAIVETQTPFTRLENVNAHKDGRPVVLETSGVPVFDDRGEFCGYRGIDRDITERKRAEEGLRQAQKMEAVGQLAGGVAHDLNNILQTMAAYVMFARKGLAPEDKRDADLREVEQAIEKAAALTRQLLAFSRRQIVQPKDLDLNALTDGVLKMLERVIGEDVDIEFIPSHKPGTVHADPVQMERILMNLCVNARDAMPEGGKLTIETENVLVNADYCATHPWAKPGRYVLLSVSDTGCGMDEETLKRVFDPFFTTKEVGKGTGLGLAAVYGIVKQRDGMIHVYSEPGKGTMVKVYLPLVERRAVAVANTVNGAVVGGTETLLVVEDDEPVRNVAVRILEEAGYTVLAAVDGEDAVEVFKTHVGEISLVLLDVVMPKRSGRQVRDEITKMNPDVAVLFTSGYSPNATHTRFVQDEGTHLIQKPYDPQSLLHKLREILDNAEERNHERNTQDSDRRR